MNVLGHTKIDAMKSPIEPSSSFIFPSLHIIKLKKIIIIKMLEFQSNLLRICLNKKFEKCKIYTIFCYTMWAPCLNLIWWNMGTIVVPFVARIH